MTARTTGRRDAPRMKGEARDDAANADASGETWTPPPPGKGEGPDTGPTQAESSQQGEGPYVADDEGLGPPDETGDDNEGVNKR